MTRLQRVVQSAGTWAPQRGRAVMPISAVVEGETDYLVIDVCQALVDRLPWATYGLSIIPSMAAPEGVGGTAQHNEIGAMVVAISPNQPAPEYADGGSEPDTSEVALILSQAVSDDLADLELLLDRRRDVLDVLAELSGAIG